jgi:uncharacterized protein YkwD
MRRAAAPLALLAVLGAAAGAAGAATASPPGVATARHMIAPAALCPGQAGAGGAIAGQERTMLCLTNFARHAAGRRELAASAPLWRAAVHKSADILRCDEFSHEACGREFTYWIQRFTSCGAVGENIAWGTGSLRTVRSIFRSWMRSPGHRENILGPYGEIGIGLRVGDLEGNAGAHVWTEDFGSDC